MEVFKHDSLPATDSEIRAHLTALVDKAWKKQGQDRNPVVYEFSLPAHRGDTHLVKVCYSVSDPTFGMERPFIGHTLNLEDGGLYSGHYDKPTSVIDW